MPDQPRATSLITVEPQRLLLKLDEAAAVLSIGKTKLYGLLRADEIPSILLGGQRYVAYQDLVDFVDGLRAEAQPYADTTAAP